MRKPKWELVPTNHGRYAYNLKASNGEVILSGIECPSKIDAMKSIVSAMEHGLNDSSYAEYRSVHGEFYFQLRNDQGSMLGHSLGFSQVYVTKQAREVGIAAVKKAITTGRIFEL